VQRTWQASISPGSVYLFVHREDAERYQNNLRHNATARDLPDPGPQALVGVQMRMLNPDLLCIDHEELVLMCLRVREWHAGRDDAPSPLVTELLSCPAMLDEALQLGSKLLGDWDYDLAAQLAPAMSGRLTDWSVRYSLARDPQRYPTSPRLMHLGPIAPHALAKADQAPAAA
jgi:hypothetical protein